MSRSSIKHNGNLTRHPSSIKSAKRTRSVSQRTVALIVLMLAVALTEQIPAPYASPSPSSTSFQTSSMGGVNMILWDDSDTRYKAIYFDWLKEYGINSVMLNFGWNKLEPTKGVYDQNYLGMMDRFIQKAEARGIYVILRMHKWPYPDAYQAQEPDNAFLLGYPAWLNNTPDFWENAGNCWDNYVAMWTMLGGRYANDPYVAGFELFSEPGNDIGPAYGDSDWYSWDSNAARKAMGVLFDNNRLYERTINSIHSITGKTVIIEPFRGGGLGYAKSPGAQPTLPSEPQSQNFAIGGSIYQYVQWAWIDEHKADANSWNAPYLATEFGVKASNIADPNPDDVAWVEQACQRFAADGMGWFYWGFGPGPNGDYNLVRQPDDAVSPILTNTLPSYCAVMGLGISTTSNETSSSQATETSSSTSSGVTSTQSSTSQSTSTSTTTIFSSSTTGSSSSSISQTNSSTTAPASTTSTSTSSTTTVVSSTSSSTTQISTTTTTTTPSSSNASSPTTTTTYSTTSSSTAPGPTSTITTTTSSTTSSYSTTTAQTTTVTSSSTSSVTSTSTTTSLTVQQLGYLRVTTNPPVASTIYLNGVAADCWGLNWVKLSPGTYVIHFSDVPGFATPADRSVTITAGVTTTVTGNFIELGYLHVTTNPALPATITIDGVVHNDWGVWVPLMPGQHTVHFGDVPGYVTPADQQVTVVAGTTVTVTGEYT